MKKLALIMIAVLIFSTIGLVSMSNKAGGVAPTTWTGLINPVHVAIGDYDNDGLNDIAFAEDIGLRVTVYKSDGTTIIKQWTGLGKPQGVAIGDYDNDGLNDIAISEYVFGTGTSRVTVYKSDGTTIIKQWTGRNNPVGVAIGDYDNDGLNDLAFTEGSGSYWGQVTVYKSDGITIIKQLAFSTGILGVAIGDYDNDGQNDLAIGMPYSGVVTVYKSDGTTIIKQWTGRAGPFGVAIGDYDNDGLNDLAFTECNPPGSGMVTVYKSDGTTVLKQWTGLASPYGVAIGDYNNDGLNDVAVSENVAGRITVYYGEGAELYVDPTPVNKNPSDLGSTFTVDVKIANVTNLYGFDINITWDSTLITYNSFSDVALDSVWGAGQWYEALNASAPGSFKLVALSMSNVFTLDPGSQTLFTITFNVVKTSNFELSTPIHFALVKLSDQNYRPIWHANNDGSYTMSAVTPGIELEYNGPAPPLEYGATLQVKVYATNISDDLARYTVSVDYDNSLLQWEFTGHEFDGSCLYQDGPRHNECYPADTDTIYVYYDPNMGLSYSGPKGLLVTLTFHVEFTGDDSSHIWRTNNPGPLHAFFGIGEWFGLTIKGPDIQHNFIKSETIMPADLDLVVNLIQGDTDCNGQVDVFDLRTVAVYYDKTSTDPEWSTISKYDLKADGIIDIFDLVVVGSNFGYGGP